MKMKFLSFFLLLFIVNDLASQFQQDTIIDSEYFGFDFWGVNKSFWAETYTLMKDDEFPFDLVGTDGVNWQKIEPNPPVNGVHTYNWGLLDTLMYYTYLAGKKVDLGIRPLSNWGTELPADSVPVSEWAMVMSAIKPDSLSDTESWGMTAKQAWKEFIYNLVERYDGDTIGHPLLPINRNTIKTLTIGNEIEAPGHFFECEDWNPKGTIEKYKEIQKLTYDTAKYANPDIIVVRGKSNPGHIFDDKPTSTEVYNRRQDFFDSIALDIACGPKYYDIYTFNYNDHYTSLLGYTAWVKQRMLDNGFLKPFMVGDARTTLYPRDNFFTSDKIMPSIYMPSDTFLIDTNSANYNELKKQWQKDKVQQSIKKLTIAGAVGAYQISLQPVYVERDFKQGKTRTYMRMYSGFFDPYVYEKENNLAKAREPLYWAVKMFSSEVTGASKQAVDLKLGNNVYAYKYIKMSGDNPIVIWNEDHFLLNSNTGLLQRNQETTVDLSSIITTPYVYVKRFPVQVNTEGEPVCVADTIERVTNVSINEFPMIVYPSKTARVSHSFVKKNDSIEIYPNPTQNILFINLKNELLQKNVEVYNINGKYIDLPFKIIGSVAMIDVSVLHNGMYFLKINNRVKKFIKN